MLLQDKETGDLVEVLDVKELIKPTTDVVSVRNQLGQEEQEPTPHPKAKLMFPSGESLPLCWLDADYKHATAA